MWLGSYDCIELLRFLTQSVFVQNILLFNFLGICSFIACSNKLFTANGLGSAVALEIAETGMLNWFAHHFITAAGALRWLAYFGIESSKLNLVFLELVIYISAIADFTKVLELIIEKYSSPLYFRLRCFSPTHRGQLCNFRSLFSSHGPRASLYPQFRLRI